MDALQNGLVQGTGLGPLNDLLTTDFFAGPLKQTRLISPSYNLKLEQIDLDV